jgi:hypothetical protein
LGVRSERLGNKKIAKRTNEQITKSGDGEKKERERYGDGRKE